MLESTTQSNNKSGQTSANTTPDPWEENLPSQSKSWQPPLDPNHEITAVPEPDGILNPEGDPTALRIPAHTSDPALNPAEVLLQEELKVSAMQAKSLWDHVRDVLALLWWRGPQDK